MEVITNFEWSTANIETLDFETWISISEAMGTFLNVAVIKWTQTVKPELLKTLSIEEWEKIADKAGFTEAWAYRQYKDKRK